MIASVWVFVGLYCFVASCAMRLLDGHDAHLNPINLRPAPTCLTVSQEATVPSNHGNVLAACEWRLVRTGSFQRPEQRRQVTTATTKWCSFKGREDGRREDLRRRGAPTTTTAMLLVPASPVLSPVTVCRRSTLWSRRRRLRRKIPRASRDPTAASGQRRRSPAQTPCEHCRHCHRRSLRRRHCCAVASGAWQLWPAAAGS